MSNPKLTPTSYVVLGLVAFLGRATSYDMKRLANMSVGYFWTFPHSQLYAEPERLAKAGLVGEEREEAGRRRRRFTITAAGEAALDAWLADADAPSPELRDVALIKLFFGADPHAIAERRLAYHEQLLQTYEGLHADLSQAKDAPRGPISTLEAGIRHERGMLAYWRELLQR